MQTMQKISLLGLPDNEWQEYFSFMVDKATHNTGEMLPMKTAPLDDFTLEATIHVPITQPIPTTTTTEPPVPPAAIHTDKHSLYDVPSRIDGLIDAYTDQQKVTEGIRINPLTSLLLASTTTIFNQEPYYIFQGTVLIKLIADPSIDVDSIFIDYK
jgi:hypothetical protein